MKVSILKDYPFYPKVIRSNGEVFIDNTTWYLNYKNSLTQ